MLAAQMSLPLQEPETGKIIQLVPAIWQHYGYLPTMQARQLLPNGIGFCSRV
jgi:hypothetical protein